MLGFMNSSLSAPDGIRRLLRDCLTGTAVGDSLGLPAENLSASTIRRRWKGRWRQRFLFGRGMVSDDTEHAVMLARALMRHPADPEGFRKAFARSLRWWLLGLPAAIGKATLFSIIRLWLGISPAKSGIFSAGNGPAMRIALAGVFFCRESALLRDYVSAATLVTHRDPKAFTGAMAVALVAARRTLAALDGRNDAVFPETELAAIDPGDADWQRLVNAMRTSLDAGDSVAQFCQSIGLSQKVTGYIYHTVPAALYALYRHPGDFRAGMEALLNCGGDTDTVGAVYGSMAGIGVEIPAEWSERICDYPWSPSFLDQQADGLALALESGRAVEPVPIPWYVIPFRSAFFLLVVLLHCVRRIVPA